MTTIGRTNTVRRLKFGFLTMIAASLASPAMAADDVGCSVKVTSVGLVPNGHVLASFSGGLGVFYICYVNSTVNVTGIGNVDAEACKAIYSTLLTAKTSQQNVMIKFTGVPNTATFCSTRNFLYDSPNSTPDYPYYIGIDP